MKSACVSTDGSSPAATDAVSGNLIGSSCRVDLLTAGQILPAAVNDGCCQEVKWGRRHRGSAGAAKAVWKLLHCWWVEVLTCGAICLPHLTLHCFECTCNYHNFHKSLIVTKSHCQSMKSASVSTDVSGCCCSCWGAAP